MSQTLQEVIYGLHDGSNVIANSSNEARHLLEKLQYVIDKLSAYDDTHAQAAQSFLSTAQNSLHEIINSYNETYSATNADLIERIHGSPTISSDHTSHSKSTSKFNHSTSTKQTASKRRADETNNSTDTPRNDSAKSESNGTQSCENQQTYQTESPHQNYLAFENYNTVLDLLECRQAAIQARNESQALLVKKLPRGFTTKGFSRNNIKSTLEKMRILGYNQKEIDTLRALADNLSKARGVIYRISARIGEIGGETALRAVGFIIFTSFQVKNSGTPSNYRLDGLAVNKRKNRIIISEYKGGGARLNKTPVRTEFFGYQPQGSDKYFQDRLLKDDRVIRDLYKDPKIRYNLTRFGNRVRFETWVIRTSLKNKTRVVKRTIILDERVRKELRNRLLALEKAERKS
jgi:hypothetical protein